jgi:hypothetical protein
MSSPAANSPALPTYYGTSFDGYACGYTTCNAVFPGPKIAIWHASVFHGGDVVGVKCRVRWNLNSEGMTVLVQVLGEENGQLSDLTTINHG